MATTKFSVELTDANFEANVKEGGQPVMVDFWAQWCGPCLQIGPSIEEIAKEYEGRAIVGKVDVDNNAKLAEQFDIRSIPTLLFFKNGELVDKIVGAAPKAALAKKLETLLG